MTKRRLASIAAALVLVFLVTILTAGAARAQDLETSAVSVVLLDPLSGKVLFEKNPHEKREPASVTKVMTLLMAIEAVRDGKISLQDEVITSANARAESDTDGSVVFLELGEKRTVEELLIGIAVGSGNDACVALAEHIAGSQEKFVELMNQRAQELGMQNTHFTNCHGMPEENHYTSAYDLALAAQEAVKHPEILKYTSIYEYRFKEDPPVVLWNTNKLLAWYEDVIDGLKTGWTQKAGYCLAATGKKNDFRLIAVVLGCPVPRSHFQEAIKLLNYGFANYTSLMVTKEGEAKKVLPVLRGLRQEVELIAASDLSVTIPKGEEDTITYVVNAEQEQLTAPVAKGTPLGQLVAFKDGEIVGQVDLVAADDIPAIGWRGLLGRVITYWFVPPESGR